MESFCSVQRSGEQRNSFFSRLSAIQRQRQTEQGQFEEPREEISEEDLEALESEIVFNDLRQAVLSDMTMPHHPIEVGIRNVCELSRAKKLQTLKLSELKELCEKLQLAVVGSLARKKSFIEPLETYAKTCTCFQTFCFHTFCRRSRLYAHFRSCAFLLTGFIS